jgi:hypothetical protein
MTLVMVFLAFHTRTPIVVWGLAMVCDTALLITYMLTKSAA